MATLSLLSHCGTASSDPFPEFVKTHQLQDFSLPVIKQRTLELGLVNRNGNCYAFGREAASLVLGLKLRHFILSSLFFFGRASCVVRW